MVHPVGLHVLSSVDVEHETKCSCFSAVAASIPCQFLDMPHGCEGVTQGVTAKDFLRRLKALHAGQQPEHEEGAEYPEGAFDWVSLGRSVAHLFRPGVGVQCMVPPPSFLMSSHPIPAGCSNSELKL